jgi:hypothetical protein
LSGSAPARGLNGIPAKRVEPDTDKPSPELRDSPEWGGARIGFTRFRCTGPPADRSSQDRDRGHERRGDRQVPAEQITPADVLAESMSSLVNGTLKEAKPGQPKNTGPGEDTGPLLVLTEAALERYGPPAGLTEEARLAGRRPEGHKAVESGH